MRRGTSTNERSIYVSVKNGTVDWLSLYQLVIVVFTKLSTPSTSFPAFFLIFLSAKFSYWMRKIDCTFLCREYWLSCFAGKILSKGCYWRYDNILGNEISVIRKYMTRKLCFLSYSFQFSSVRRISRHPRRINKGLRGRVPRRIIVNSSSCFGNVLVIREKKETRRVFENLEDQKRRGASSTDSEPGFVYLKRNFPLLRLTRILLFTIYRK